ncbi:hypothetical protein Poli38472_013936 [Pythium oligandrum]|uniref:FACT complex subunit n=1 Tax=Pythium oligandrum TaxID=41045 RepID=A0A8K1C2E5_PYTOL|nr:hypothetical protein Poli38472_013936 [Pythium oligandrum]|eukprot:TMW55174.1 hypothetical protein Poli38472_013936 [Pythium oligandrum]
MELKTLEEIEGMHRAGAFVSKVFRNRLVADMETIIDEDRTVSHEAIAAAVEEVFDDPRKLWDQSEPGDVRVVYPPIVQSGGKYDLKPGVQSNSDALKYDVIICSLGAELKGYSAAIARTFFIDPAESMKESYELLREAHDLCAKELRPGKTIATVVETIYAFIQSRDTRLFGKLTKNLGFGIGSEFSESRYPLSVENTTVVAEGMAFNLAFGFQDIPIEQWKIDNYTIYMADTVMVMENETTYVTNASKLWDKVNYTIEDDVRISDQSSPAMTIERFWAISSYRNPQDLE